MVPDEAVVAVKTSNGTQNLGAVESCLLPWSGNQRCQPGDLMRATVMYAAGNVRW
jgi:hypothetical protein